METGEPIENKIELAPRPNRTPSFSDQLLGSSLIQSDIPYEIRTDPTFLEQVEARKKLIAAYTEHNADPTNSLSKKILHEQLSHTFESDTDFARAALYIPFSLLPDANNQENDESKNFISSYKSAFAKLLTQIDFRADFVDGDILEPELRGAKLPDQIVKAPHLLPWLMRKGIFSQEEVLSMIEEAQVPQLIQSLVDVIPILYRESLLDDRVLTVLSATPYEAFHKLAPHIQGLTKPKEQPVPERTPKEILTSFSHAYEAMIKRVTSVSTSENRQIWQIEVQGERLCNEFAYILAQHVDTTLDTATLDTLLEQNDSPHTSLILTALTIKAGIEFETEGTVTKHTELLINHAYTKTSDNKSKEIVHALDKLLKYSFHYGVTVPSQEMPQFAQNEETSRTKSYFESLTSCARFIEDDPTLSQYLYPVVVSLGSHAKGYAKEGSDTDMCVFVKAGTREQDRAVIQEKLKEMSSTLGIYGSCMEFWMEENEHGVSIKNYENPDQSRGDSLLSHPFTGEWVGNVDATKKLRQNLMKMYMKDGNKVLAGHTAKEAWLHDIEHNMLQYRLMHKGYTSNMPPEKIKPNHGNFPIDGESIFYDDGYRRIAFDLYLKKIFIPTVPTTE